MTDQQQIITDLTALVDEGRIKTDQDSLKQFGCDWTKMYDPAPLAVLFPKTAEQVQAIVRYANEHQVNLVPSGGRTGLSAAAVAANGEVVVAFDLMTSIKPIDLCAAGLE